MHNVCHLDHIVLAVNDLERARTRFGELGFTTTPRARHPWGTANSLIQLQHGFIELLEVAEPEKLVPHGPDQFSFSAFNERFLGAREGMSMLVFSSTDARADQRRWQRAGLHTYPPVYFERQATLPGGEQRTVAFTVAFVTHPRVLNAGFFVCQHHTPEAFWQAEYQRHAHGARDITEVTLLAPDPGALQPFFAAVLGEKVMAREGAAVTATLDGGRLTVCDAHDFDARYPGSARPDDGELPLFVAFSVAVDDPRTCRTVLERHQLEYRELDHDRLQIPADELFGVTLELVP